MKRPGCPLCQTPGGVVVFDGPRFRVIRAEEPDFPGFYRLVWTDHVAEFSQLSPADRSLCMEAVAVVEQALRQHLRPVKVNLAALGNVVPHLHWHIVARFAWDSRFPAPVWAPVDRVAPAGALLELKLLLPGLEQDLFGRLAARPENRTAP